MYGLLLSGYDTGVIPWVNTVVHHIMPVVLVPDWLIDPPRDRVSAGRAMRWLVFPIVFLGYSLIRGPIVGWYPYPFLDPRQHGYPRVAIACLCIAAAFVLVTLALVGLSRVLGARRRSGTAARTGAMNAS